MWVLVCGKSGLNSDLTKPLKNCVTLSHKSLFLFCIIGVIINVKIEMMFLKYLEFKPFNVTYLFIESFPFSVIIEFWVQCLVPQVIRMVSEHLREGFSMHRTKDCDRFSYWCGITRSIESVSGTDILLTNH